MIKNLNLDFTPRAFDRGLRQEPSSMRREESANFADQLLGAKSRGLESLDRTERNIRSKILDRDGKSGREFGLKTDREDNRLAERDRDSDVRERLRAKTDDRSPQDVRRDRNRAEETNSEKARDRDRAEKKKKEDVRLPDFFSDSALPSRPSLASLSPAQEAGAQAGTLSSVGKGETQQTVALMKAIRDEGVNSQNGAMAEFLERMQEELGVPPERILQAFSELSGESLAAPPRESVDEFVSNLQLDASQSKLAEQIFGDLLSATDQAELDQKLAGLSSDVNIDVLSRRDEMLRKLDSSLNDLNRSFFGSEEALGSSEKLRQQIDQMDVELSRLMNEVSGAASDLGAGQNSMAVESDSSADLINKSSSTHDRDPSIDSDLRGDIVAIGAMSEGQERAGNDSGAEGGSSGGPGSDAAFGQQLSSMSQSDRKVQNQSVRFSDGEMLMSRQPTPQDEQSNIRELIRQAQVVLRKGGGEMKMEMKPEGMGQVHLRVAVENGQINIQMLTESDSAKRLLESGLSDLKAGLAAEQLRVESLKIDVGREIQKQMDQSAQQNLARDQARQFAQDFMGGFREERQSFRQDQFGSPGFRSYARSQPRASVEPDPVVQASALRSGGARRLNLVA